ncbi:hypothetical protein GCK32_019142 [Trichostrongylus colubriformis]|uniref:Uncharacterized protein n=1 Tax=Trichostrongylus colubriformis TaxID=6319 RepID=A0AAN8FNV0_TRICO
MENNMPDFPGNVMSKFAEVVKEKIWAFDPDKRANMRQIMIWMQAYTGMELQIIGGESSLTATVHQKMDALISRDVELRAMPGFEEPGQKTPLKKKKKK